MVLLACAVKGRRFLHLNLTLLKYLIKLAWQGPEQFSAFEPNRTQVDLDSRHSRHRLSVSPVHTRTSPNLTQRGRQSDVLKTNRKDMVSTCRLVIICRGGLVKTPRKNFSSSVFHFVKGQPSVFSKKIMSKKRMGC